MVLPTTRQRHPSFNQGIFLRICYLSSDSTWLRPAGISTSSPGIIDWAGGTINRKDPDYQSADETVDDLGSQHAARSLSCAPKVCCRTVCGSRAARPEEHVLRLWCQFLSSDTDC